MHVGLPAEAMGCLNWGKFSNDLPKATDVGLRRRRKEEFSRGSQRIVIHHFGC